VDKNWDQRHPDTSEGLVCFDRRRDLGSGNRGRECSNRRVIKQTDEEEQVLTAIGQ